MDFTSFHKLRTAVQENAHPAAPRHATTLEQALHTALSGSGLFSSIEIGRTEDPDQLIIGVCRCADGILPWEAGMGMERLWDALAAAAPWEAHHVGCTDSMMEFEGAMTVDDSAHYLTVHLVAEPAAAAPAPAPADLPASTDSARV